MKEVKINFHYTNRCDMHCYHCFEGINNSKLDEDQVIETFQALCRLTKAINLVGGEVFTNIKLLKKLVKIGLENRVMLSIVSNGYILLNSLDSEDCKYILKNIKMLGISIDSFNDKTNQLIGREVDGKALSVDKLTKLNTFLIKYNTKLKINTVVTQNNLSEKLSDNICKFKPNIWKILQVSTENEKIKVSNEEFECFIDCNKSNLETRIEYSNIIKKAYVMINANGQLYFNGKFTSINVNDKIEESNYNSNSFFEKLHENNIDLTNYYSRYSHEGEVKFNKSAYHRQFRKKISKNGNILFLDVESFTPRPSESRNLLRYTTTQIHLLYCGLVINQNMEILSTFSDNIDYKIDIKTHIDKSSSNTKVFEEFYKNFLLNLRKYTISTIVVSGLDTETNFLLDAIYYIKNLKRKDFEFIEKEFNHLLDIQLIRKKDILVVESKKIASRNVNEILYDYRSDIFVHQREGEKDLESSHKISLDLADVYFKSYPDKNKQNIINEVREHCFKDVFDDFEVLYAYELLSKSSIKF